MAKVNASPKKKVQAKLNPSAQLMAPPADPSVNAPRKFSGFTGEMGHLTFCSFVFIWFRAVHRGGRDGEIQGAQPFNLSWLHRRKLVLERGNIKTKTHKT